MLPLIDKIGVGATNALAALLAWVGCLYVRFTPPSEKLINKIRNAQNSLAYNSLWGSVARVGRCGVFDSGR